jgi:hypothetical protein
MKHKPNPLHQKETEWRGEVYFIEGESLSPEDPEFKRRAARGPNAPKLRDAKKRGGKKPKK